MILVQDTSMWNNVFQRISVFLFMGLLFAQNQSYRFQDADFVNILSDATLQVSTGVTVEGWVKPESDHDYAPILHFMRLGGPDQESGYSLMYFENELRFFVCVGTGNYDIVGDGLQLFPGATLPLNEWSHVAGTYNVGTSEAIIYLNGVQQASFVTEGGNVNWDFIDTMEMKIGKGEMNPGVGDEYFDGNIDEMRVWNIPLDAESIQNIMCDSLTTPQSNLVGHWNFNDAAGLTINDQSGNGNNGTLNNGGTGDWDDDVYDDAEVEVMCPSSESCFDMEITEASFPFNHLADLTTEDDDWDQATFPYPGGGEHSNGANGMDYTYKLTLNEPATIYISTCDSETNVDVQIAVYTGDCDISSWVLFQDDSNLEIFFPDGTSEQYEFECISGFDSNPTYANMLPALTWDAGTYYIVVDDRNGGSGSVRTWVGYSLIVDSTSTSADYSQVNYFFSEGVYGGEYQDVYNGNGIGLEDNDFSVDINANGGNADEVNLISLESATGLALNGGEETVILNVEYPSVPSGGEILNVGPASVSSIFNSVGVPLLDIDGISIPLVDALSPTIETTYPDNGDMNIATNANISITFSESVRHSSDSPISNANAIDCFTLENATTGDDYAFSISTNDNITFTMNPDESLPEATDIRIFFSNAIEDENDNAFATQFITFTTADETPPIIQTSTLASSNAYVSIEFNEGVFSTDAGTGGLDASDLDFTFTRNGGNCESVTLSNIFTNTMIGLSGGETTIRAILELSNAPSGVETITFNPMDNGSIYDMFGNAMASTQITDPVTLFASVMMDSIFLPDSNEYVDLTFTGAVYGNEGHSQPVIASDFSILFESNGGNATSVSLTGISRNTGDALLGGESTVRLFLSFDNLPSGVETITLSPSDESKIFSISGVSVPSGESFGPILLNDQSPPTSDTNVNDGAINYIESDPVSLSFTENIYHEDGSAVTAEDLPNYIVLRTNSIAGEDIPFSTTLSGEPPTISVIPNEPFASDQVIYFTFNAVFQDENGNSVIVSYEMTFTVRDYLPPQIDSTYLSLDNAYIDLVFDDLIYRTDNMEDPLNANDIEAVLIPNGSETTECTVSSLTRTDSNFLIGGETNIRANLQFDKSPSGVESLILLPREEVNIFDEVGNEMEYQPLTDTLQLYDILPPSIDTISVPIDSYITLMESTPIVFMFNEEVDSLNFSVTASFTDTVSFSHVISDTSIAITLEPPLTSMDSITVYFSYLEDASGISTVDIAYTYLTPMLGDYNLDTLINYTDLADLVSHWNENDLTFELGPVTGEAPHFVSFPDSKYDLDDGMAFMQMWSWYQKTYGEILPEGEGLGRPIQMNQSENMLYILPDQTVFSGQIDLYLDQNMHSYSPPHFTSLPHQFSLSSHQIDKQFSSFVFAKKDESIQDTIKISLPDRWPHFGLSYSFSDKNQHVLQKGNIRINQSIIPNQVRLYPAFPNPFNPTTNFTFDVPSSERPKIVQLSIFDITGRLVHTLANQTYQPGTYTLQWNGRQFASGLYFVQLAVGPTTKTQKILLLK